jgi:hypothetical protein
MPGDSKFDGRGQRKFIRNMAAGGAIGAAGGNVGAKLATRGRSKLRPIRSGAAGGVLAGGAGVAMVAHQRKKKVHKTSAFGVVHGYPKGL